MCIMTYGPCILNKLQGKSKKVRVIGSSKQIAGIKGKTSFRSTLNIFITFNSRNVISESWKILLDYKSERNVTEHSLNRAWGLLLEK